MKYRKTLAVLLATTILSALSCSCSATPSTNKASDAISLSSSENIDEAVEFEDSLLEGYFKRDENGIVTKKSILSKERLDLFSNDIKSLDGLQYAKNLKHLYIQGPRIRNYDALSDLKNLEELTITGSYLPSTKVLSSLTNLKKLWIGNSQLSDLTGIENLKNLESLNLYNNNISDISNLTSLENLTYLELGLNNISDISSLANLKNLKRLYLASNNIESISPIKNLVDLTTLVLIENNIQDASPIEPLSHLQFLALSDNPSLNTQHFTNFTCKNTLYSLFLSNCGLRNLNFLKNFTSISYLEANNNSISSISGINSSPSLHRLFLSNNNISVDKDNYTALSKLENMAELDLSHNNLGNLNLPKLPNLYKINISDANITSLPEFKNISSNLHTLNASNSHIKNFDCLNGLDNLKLLYLNHLSIDSLSPLQIDSLYELFISDSNLDNIDFLDINFEDIEVLDLSGNSFTNLEFLKKFSERESGLELLMNRNPLADFDGLKYANITTLFIDDVGLKDLSNLLHFDSIYSLYARNNDITSVELSEKQSHFYRLDLSNNNISQIKNLNLLNNLGELRLSHNNIEKIDSLNTFKDLRILKLDNNALTEVPEINNLKELEVITLDHNKINDLTNLTGFSPDYIVHTLNLSHNKINNLHGLENLRVYMFFLDNNDIHDLTLLESMDSPYKISIGNNPIEINSSLDESIFIPEYDSWIKTFDYNIILPILNDEDPFEGIPETSAD